MYDARYAEAGPILELLGLGLAIYPIQVIRSAFTAIGKTYVAAIVSVVQAISLVCCLLAGFFMFGAHGGDREGLRERATSSRTRGPVARNPACKVRSRRNPRAPGAPQALLFRLLDSRLLGPGIDRKLYEHL